MGGGRVVGGQCHMVVALPPERTWYLYCVEQTAVMVRLQTGFRGCVVQVS